MLTKSMAVELAKDKIRVNAVNPVMGETAEATRLVEAQSSEMRYCLRSLAAINQVPPGTATSVRLLVDARCFYPALEAAIARAE